MLTEADVNEYAARQLRALRAARGISQTKLAREMNMSPQQVQKYEWGINRLSVGRLMQFAEAFDVSVNVLLPNRDRHYSHEPVPPATMRFIKLLNKIMPSYWDDIYEALKVMARLSGKERP